MPGWELIGQEEQDAVRSVFQAAPPMHFFTNRKLVREFEQAFAASLGAADAVAVSSGTAALKVALKALGVGPGDEVITQAHTFVATVEAIVDCGATPVIADIDESLNMDPQDLRRKVTTRTKVILPVHMLGVACDMDDILTLAKAHHLAVIEDTAQACHGTYHGWPLGTLGDLGCFSFSYSKMLTTGEGGMVLARDPLNLAAARSYADHGHDFDPTVPSRGQDTHMAPGFNYRMGSFSAVIGQVQLKKMAESLTRHRTRKARLKDLVLRKLPALAYRCRRLQDDHGDTGDAFCFFLPTERQAQQVARRLFEKDGIALKNLPDALNWHCADHWEHILGAQARTLTKSGNLLRRTVAIQISALWEPEEIEKVAEQIARAVMAAA
jgi:8-amino-3,8-dideoxy-alpha-D-manno-octulosonate transaminase